MVSTSSNDDVVLEVKDLRTYFQTRWGTVKAVDGDHGSHKPTVPATGDLDDSVLNVVQVNHGDAAQPFGELAAKLGYVVVISSVTLNEVKGLTLGGRFFRRSAPSE